MTRLIHLLFAFLAVPALAHATVVEYYDAGLDRYFLTADPDEMNSVETGGAGRGWVRTGYPFDTAGSCVSASNGPCPSRPVCRFYGALPMGSGSHFYTVDENECRFVRENDRNWVFEGIAFNAYAPNATTRSCPTGTRPVYRPYNNGYSPGANHANHRQVTANRAPRTTGTRPARR